MKKYFLGIIVSIIGLFTFCNGYEFIPSKIYDTGNNLIQNFGYGNPVSQSTSRTIYNIKFNSDISQKYKLDYICFTTTIYQDWLDSGNYDYVYLLFSGGDFSDSFPLSNIVITNSFQHLGNICFSGLNIPILDYDIIYSYYIYSTGTDYYNRMATYFNNSSYTFDGLYIKSDTFTGIYLSNLGLNNRGRYYSNLYGIGFSDYGTPSVFTLNYNGLSEEYVSDVDIYLENATFEENNNVFQPTGLFNGINLNYFIESNSITEFYSKDKLYLSGYYNYLNNVFNPICS